MKKSISPAFFILIFFLSSFKGISSSSLDNNSDSNSPPSSLESTSKQGGNNNLFISLGSMTAQAETNDPTIIRSQLVSIRFDLLPDPSSSLSAQSAQVPDTLQLNLFPDVNLVANLDHIEQNLPGMTSWVGNIEGVQGSEAILVIGEDGIVSGNIVISDAFYEIRYVSPGIHAIYQINQSAFPEETSVALDNPPLASPSVEAHDALTDNGSVIDVMVVYTAVARAAAGGTSAIQSAINLAVTETNNAYANSGISQRVNLVYTNEVSYAETGDIRTDLDNVTFGSIANVQTWRDQYAADLVTMITENGGAYCGIAWMMQSVSTSFAPYGYSVVARSCATGYYSVAHEMGHNMGATHDWAVDNSTLPYIYNKGYVYLPGRWRTIMSYDNQCEDSGFYCTRLPFFSNPTLTYGGVPMGVAGEGYPAADNHRVLNNTAYTVANFRQGLHSPTNLAASINHMAMQINLSWIDQSSDETGFSIERKLTGSGSWVQIGTVSTNIQAYQDASFTCNTSYDYQVSAYNSNQSSSPSNAITVTTPICPPSGLNSSPLSQKRIRLQWSDNSSNETGFRLQRSPNGVSNWVQIGSDLPANTLSYIDYPLTCGTTYYYRVIAFNSVSTTPSNILNTCTNSCAAPPQPTGISSTPASIIMIQITWADILDDETSYAIYRSFNGTSGWTQIGTTSENSTSFLDQGLTIGTQYFYRVAAINSYGNSDYSSTSSSSTYQYGIYSPIIIK